MAHEKITIGRVGGKPFPLTNSDLVEYDGHGLTTTLDYLCSRVEFDQADISSLRTNFSLLSTRLDEEVGSLTSLIENKQDKLVSGENIKTVNGHSVIGSGDVEIKGDKGDPFRFEDFTPEELEQIRGPQGFQGNSGYQGAAEELEVVNNLTQGGATAALSAEMGKELLKLLTPTIYYEEDWDKLTERQQLDIIAITTNLVILEGASPEAPSAEYDEEIGIITIPNAMYNAETGVISLSGDYNAETGVITLSSAKPTPHAEYDEESGVISARGEYNEETGIISMQGEYDEENGIITI